ncbi:hypothetical protein N7451_007726 [Penicillium sp. IBT 35674x]|nr:hypothetical protein N7451_007726 [Penicillium sp. IBT 35674x]
MLLTILSFLVLVVVFTSFIPHIRQAWLGKRAGDISLLYLLFNVICSTEHLFFAFFFTINLRLDDLPEDLPPDIRIEPYWTHFPRNALDWINFSQVMGVWALFNILLGLNLYHRLTSRLRKTLIVVVYISFLIFSLGPLIIDAVSDTFCPLDHPDCPWHERDVTAFLEGLHSFVLLPFLSTIPLVIGIYKQVRSPLQTQSLMGLKLQIAAFMLSAVFWVPRLSAPWDLFLEYLNEGHPINIFILGWYRTVGFETVNDFVFAWGQGMLLWLTLRQNRRAEEGERQPLLA